MRSKPTQPEARMRPNTELQTVIQDFLNHMGIRNLSPNTLESYTRVLQHYVRHLAQTDKRATIRLSSVTLESARSYVAARMAQDQIWLNHPNRVPIPGKLSPHTLHRQTRVLRTFGNWLNKNGYPNTVNEVELPKLPRVLIDILSEAEITKLYEMYNANTHFGARWQAILAFFLQTGVRLSELANLKSEHLDLENYRAKVDGKGSKERWVTFGTKAAVPLMRYLREFRPKPKGADNVFLNLDGTPLTPTSLGGIMRIARKNSGIARFHTHLLRHTFATNYLMAGGNVFDLQDQLGHEDLEMTRRYVHLARTLSRTGVKPEQLERRRQLLDSMPGLIPPEAEDPGVRKRSAGGRFARRAEPDSIRFSRD